MTVLLLLSEFAHYFNSSSLTHVYSNTIIGKNNKIMRKCIELKLNDTHRHTEGKNSFFNDSLGCLGSGKARLAL